MKRLLITAAALMPVAAFAAGGGADTAPVETNTTIKCEAGQVWSEASQSCVNPQSGALDDDTLYGAVREFAYAGQLDNALVALAAMSDPQDDRVLTYLGFINRKLGNMRAANDYYQQALDANPNNILARSYMGQGKVTEGDLVGARAQLLEIRARGGEGTWAETALLAAITTGTTFDY